MKLRLAWLGDARYEDSYCAHEARILLPALARSSNILPLWFAVGSSQPPHIWNGVRVFPIPMDCLTTASFFRTLMAQQRPQVVLSNLRVPFISEISECLDGGEVRWIHRISPEDLQSGWSPAAPTVLVGEEALSGNFANSRFVPYIDGLGSLIRNGADSTTVLQRLNEVLGDGQAVRSAAGPANQTHLIMRQQLFCNTSVAQVMFELTNALMELGIPAVPQEEHAIFANNSYIRREEDLFRLGASEKYERIRRHLEKKYDPENAITIHFVLLRAARAITHCGTFPSLSGREVVYTTGNHTVAPDFLQTLTNSFDMVLAPSEHVLRPYLEAGLSRKNGAVVPHGIDPLIYSPGIAPYEYPTKKRFKFLQTSFPWVCEKGFDLTIKAFCQAFSNRDDVSLILRIPKVEDPLRNTHLGELEALLKEELAKPRAPEILLLEADVELNRRGGIYTGADCYVHPLRAEGFGMTILEAMACGLPVIATPWSGPADFLSPRWAYTLRHSRPVPEKNNNGSILRYHVEPELEHLVHLMRYAYEHVEEGKALGGRAASVARDRWTWKRAAVKLASLFFPALPHNGHRQA